MLYTGHSSTSTGIPFATSNFHYYYEVSSVICHSVGCSLGHWKRPSLPRMRERSRACKQRTPILSHTAALVIHCLPGGLLMRVTSYKPMPNVKSICKKQSHGRSFGRHTVSDSGILSGLEWVRSHAHTDTHPALLYGHSLGSLPRCACAPKDKPRVEAKIRGLHNYYVHGLAEHNPFSLLAMQFVPRVYMEVS